MSHHSPISTIITPRAVRKSQDINIAELLRMHDTSHRISTQKGGQSLLAHLNAFAGCEVSIKSVNRDFCIHFAQYLLKHICINSAKTYLQKFHALLRDAVAFGILSSDPMPRLSDLLPHFVTPIRCHLSVNSLKKLENANCLHETTKLAFLFSCYTGLRLSDIETLTWGEIYKREGCLTIVKIQVKTDHEVSIPLGKNAQRILKRVCEKNGALAHPDIQDLVFQLKSRTCIASDLVAWAKAANVDEHITFHVARHTFATLSITAGNSLYVVSQLCGHSNIKTTQIYANVVDSVRIKAIFNLDRLLSEHRKRVVLSCENYIGTQMRL